MKKPNVFIRGIYSTALTKLFIDAGYSIIYPSKEIQNRFNIPFRNGDSYSKDITINDRYDKQGISIMVKKHIWEELEENNFEDFPITVNKNQNFITLHSRFHRNSIYRGIVVRSNKRRNFSYVRLTPEQVKQDGDIEPSEFKTTLGFFNNYLEEGKEGIFQVTHEDFGGNPARLGSYYTVPGDLVVINPFSNKVLISKKILNSKKKKSLFDLGKDLQIQKKYGYIFRTAAELATKEEILEEANNLEKDLIEIQKLATQNENIIGILYSNYRTLNIVFPYPVKNEFNKIRANIIPTIDFHHTIKSVLSKDDLKNRKRSQYHDLLEYTEDIMAILEKKESKKVQNVFLKRFFKNINKRTIMNINHLKLSGKMLSITSGKVRDWRVDSNEPLMITLKRRLYEGGLYDGLGTPIERGDYALSTFEENNWYYISEYFSYNHEPKGKYININTPIEISNDTIQYIDLEIDVVENVAGERKIIDKEKLEETYKIGIISQEIYDKALLIAQNLKGKKI